MATEKRLHWSKYETRNFAYNDKGEELGYLELEKVGQHYHWCWYQDVDIRMSPMCLQEVRDMQKELFKDRQKTNSGKTVD